MSSVEEVVPYAITDKSATWPLASS